MNAQVRVTVAVCAAISGPTLAQTPSFNLVGFAPGGSGSNVTGLSADGSVAAGFTTSPSGNFFPGFTWTRAGGRNDFGVEAGLPIRTEVYGISGDGSTVVGHAGATYTTGSAFHYRGPGTFQTLGVLPGLYNTSGAFGVSGDGSVVVGASANASLGIGQAFRWTQAGGMLGLGFTRSNGFASQALGVSRDGSTIVGESDFGPGDHDAFVWTQAGGMRILPQLPGTPVAESTAYAANFDGSIIVGRSGMNQRFTMWRNGTPIDLGSPGFPGGGAEAVNDDGSVVAGYLLGASQFAAVWTPSRGMESLSDYLTRNGVAIPVGWSLVDCIAVSSDGRTFAGRAFSAAGGEGFVATTPAPATIAFPLVLLVIAERRRRG